MTTSKAVTQQQQQVPHHYSPEAMAAMTVAGIAGIFGVVVAFLLLVKLARSAFGRKPAMHHTCNCHQHFEERQHRER